MKMTTALLPNHNPKQNVTLPTKTHFKLKQRSTSNVNIAKYNVLKDMLEPVWTDWKRDWPKYFNKQLEAMKQDNRNISKYVKKKKKYFPPAVFKMGTCPLAMVIKTLVG